MNTVRSIYGSKKAVMTQLGAALIGVVLVFGPGLLANYDITGDQAETVIQTTVIGLAVIFGVYNVGQGLADFKKEAAGHQVAGELLVANEDERLDLALAHLQQLSNELMLIKRELADSNTTIMADLENMRVVAGGDRPDIPSSL